MPSIFVFHRCATRLLPSATALLWLVIISAAAPGQEEVENVVGERDKYYARSHRAVHENHMLSPRARGLGGTYAAIVNGTAGVIENPAGLGAQTDRQVLSYLGVDSLEDGDNCGHWLVIGAGGSFNLNACMPETWIRENVGNQTVGFFIHHSGIEWDNAGELASDLDGLVMAYGRSFRNGKAFGGVAIGIFEGDWSDDRHLVDRNYSRWEFKAGGIYRATSRMAFGGHILMALGDIANDATYLNWDGDVAHFEMRGGAAYELTARTLVAADISHGWWKGDLEDSGDRKVEENHDVWRLSAGLEHIVIPSRLTARGGIYYTHDDYQYASGGDARSVEDAYFGAAGGLSWYRDEIEIGYTLDLRDTGEMGNYFTFGYNW